MAKPYVVGPCFCFVGIGPGFAPVFLGTAERTPRIQIRPHWGTVFNDIAGVEVPFDWIYQGEEAFITMDLTRYNEIVYDFISSRPRTSTANPPVVQGQNVPGDIGTLMISEGFAYPLWMVFPYSIKPAFSADMPAGYRFTSTWLEGPDDFDNLNTLARRTRLVFHAGRAYQLGSSFGGEGMILTLYDHDMSAVGDID